MTDTQPDPLAYGAAGYRCGCGKNAHSNLVPCQLDEDPLCTSEFPGDDTFAGQLCQRQRGHDGKHEYLAAIAGTPFTCHLIWN